MPVTFDGPNKLVICTSGTTSINLKDVYSRWKDWVQAGSNAKFLQAFTVIGGDPLTGAQSLGATFFLENGWKIRPQESNHILVVEGNLYARSGSPFVSTLGSYNVRIEMRVSNLIDIIATNGGGGGGGEIDPASLWSHPIDGLFTAEQVMRLMASALAGVLSGAGTDRVIIQSLDGTKDRITARVDAVGNRTEVELDPS